MDFRANEQKWQKIWEDTRLYSFDKTSTKPKLYVMEMFSYPSGAKLHVGHWYNYGPADSFARFKRMQGYNVFHPMGFDAFGLPAENYAIKTGVHPQDSTFHNMEIMEGQLHAMGSSVDWDYSLKTCMPEYYRWTQWLFLQLYKKGLAYRKEAPVNWCPSCNTVLANEQVVEGGCERCHTPVIRKNLTQWFFKITDYADELLNDLDGLDWPERIKAMQRNWIGRSEGAELQFKLENGKRFPVFTTRADTVFGCTYCVLAPEHPLVDEITTPDCRAAVDAYRDMAAHASDIDRMSATREKTGVFTGAYAINPATGQKVPVWIADYVLYTYGTGSIMAVPAHDTRDFEFATKFNLPIVQVIKGGELPYTGDGTLINSGQFDGMQPKEAVRAIVDWLGKDTATLKVNYRMRDWLVSRQRYWGAPIPIIHCPHCGTVPVPESDLPVRLPYDVDFTPDGTSPLLKHEGFMNVKCPVCGADARRDPDTMDTFVCSSWYYLRYPTPHDDTQPFDRAVVDKLLPVDAYIGGAEHACMHLLYARFITKALRDMGYLDFDEPFQRLINQGIILGSDNEKMSKSRGNVVSPDDYIGLYGSDVFRTYLMFGFNYVEGGAWSDGGIKAIARFFERVERLMESIRNLDAAIGADLNGPREKDLKYAMANTVKNVTIDTDRFMFNTAIARIMEFVNALYKYRDGGAPNNALLRQAADTLVLCLAPFAPHFAEELHTWLGNTQSVFNRAWPDYNPDDLKLDVANVAVQINGKIKARLDVSTDAAQDAVLALAQADAKVQEALAGKTIRKVVYVPGRLLNIVAN